MKLCISCSSEKQNNKGMYCKTCAAENNRHRSRLWRLENPARAAAGVAEWVAANKERSRELKRKYFEANKDAVVAGKRTSSLAKYGIDAEKYDTMYVAQAGCCAICGRHRSSLKQNLSVDHDHKTNKIRGLLCGKCNRGIGMFNDSDALLSAAIRYLAVYAT